MNSSVVKDFIEASESVNGNTGVIVVCRNCLYLYSNIDLIAIRFLSKDLFEV